jgi:hypothetical protein
VELALKRRWFVFSLRTLFVVVTLAAVGTGWIVYHLDWMRQRRQAFASHTILVPLACDFGLGERRRTPWPLWILGEEEAPPVFFFPPSTPEEEVERISKLFPEVDVCR